MQSIAVRVAFAVLAGAWLFSAGLLIGREIPAHHFERFGNTGYLFDASSGYICNATNPALPDPWDKYAVPAPAANDPFVPYGGHAVDPNAKSPNPIDQALTKSTDPTGHIKPCVP